MPKTGETCTKKGNYAGSCTEKPATHATLNADFQVGDTFTPCYLCGSESRTPGGAVANWTWQRS